jgi:hypothetical protein
MKPYSIILSAFFFAACSGDLGGGISSFSNNRVARDNEWQRVIDAGANEAKDHLIEYMRSSALSKPHAQSVGIDLSQNEFPDLLAFGIPVYSIDSAALFKINEQSDLRIITRLDRTKARYFYTFKGKIVFSSLIDYKNNQWEELKNLSFLYLHEDSYAAKMYPLVEGGDELLILQVFNNSKNKPRSYLCYFDGNDIVTVIKKENVKELIISWLKSLRSSNSQLM